jgi:hypothetical protein
LAVGVIAGGGGLTVAQAAAVALTATATAAIVETAAPAPARADNLWLHTCSYYNDIDAEPTWSVQKSLPPPGDSAWVYGDHCSTGASFGLSTTSGVSDQHWEQWGTSSPGGILIDEAWTPSCSGGCSTSQQGVLINCDLGADHYVAFFEWGPNHGSQRIVNNDGGGCPYNNNKLADGTPLNDIHFGATSWFGVQLRCQNTGGSCPALDAAVGVKGIQLGATETASPSLNAYGANNLFNHGGWVRGGGFAIALGASDPSGICNLRANLNGTWIQGPTSGLNQSSWVQCSAPSPWTGPSIDTGNYADGTGLQLYYQAENAAGNWSTSPTATSYVDNTPVELSLAGPTHAPITAGTEHVTATSSANPSGDTIWCSTDGGQWAAYSGSSARIAVNGLGSHLVRCYAEDSAVNASGSPGRSRTQTWSLDIGEPVRGKITFGKVSSHCHRARKRVGGRVKRVWVCHRSWVERTVRRSRYGGRATVRGWFATVDGRALAHVPVSIETAVDNARHRWRRVAVVHTGANGGWRAALRPGPSRLVEAVYAGGPLTAPKTTAVVRLMVIAKVVLTNVPGHVPWGGTLAIRGRVLGGHVPGGQILRLLDGAGRRLHTIGNPTIRGDGRFVIRLQTSGGGGPLRVQVAVGTLRERDYPYAPGVSRRVWITLG